MQIRFERSGGFAGLTLSTTIDPNELPPKEAKELLTSLDESGILTRPNEGEGELESAPGTDDTPEDAPAPMGYVDEMTYRLTVEVGDYEHTVCVTESEMTPEMVELFRCLTQMARRSPGS